jgi:hypothetical protein
MKKLYPQNYDSIEIQPEYMPYKIAVPVARPELLIWGTAMIAAAFGFAPPAVAAGFPGLAGGVSDEMYLEAEEDFAEHARDFDEADGDCRRQSVMIKLMTRAWKMAGRDRDLGKQLRMRANSHKRSCR